MKAIRIKEHGGVEVLQTIDLPVPEPGPGQVRIKVEAAGINFADVLTRRGTYYPLPKLPIVLGTDAAGTIDALGEGVTHLQAGQRVVAVSFAGAYAQYVIAPALAAVPLPDDIDVDLAAGLPVSGMTAYHLTHTVAPPAPGQTVVNYAAAGSVGSLVNGLAKDRGATVIALVGSEEKAARARELGADHTINYRAESDVPARVRELTGGRGAEVIYNSLMGQTIADDFAMLAPLGHIVWFGIAAGMPNTKLLLAAMMRKFPDAPTVTLYHLLASIQHDPQRHLQGWQELFAALREGRARLPIHAVFPLSEAAAAHDEIESRVSMGKIILKPWA